MPTIFPDTCVFIDFACVNRLDVLRYVVKDNGRWCASVKQEVESSGRYHAVLSDVQTFMPEPLVPSTAELQDALMLKSTFFDEVGDPKSAHMGECEMLAVAARRFGHERVMVLTRDEKLIAYCAQDSNGFLAVTTTQVLEVAHKAGRGKLGDLAEVHKLMLAAGRSVAPPVLPALEEVEAVD